jgi:hypothetical protein
MAGGSAVSTAQLQRRADAWNTGREHTGHTFGQVAWSGQPDDVIDALMIRLNGNVMRPPSDAGEGDGYRQACTRRAKRRLTAAGLLDADGVPADVLADMYGWQRGADEFAVWYVAECVRGLDIRDARRRGSSWAERPEPAPAALPESLVDYLNRLLCERKRQYAAAVTLAIVEGAPIPASSERWAEQVIAKVHRYWQRGG